MSQLNPFAFPDPFGQSFQPQAPRASPIPPITKEDEQSLLEKIGSAGLGGLSFIGGILNKPGRVIRGTLGGQPRELLNAIPFSDALGITKPEQEVRGVDILRNLGIHNEEDPSLLSPAGIAGFGVDVLTDPLTYLSFGSHALTKAGQAAKKAGTLPSTVAERAAQGLGGHVGVGLPFAGNAATFDLAPAANAIAGAVRSIPGGNTVADLANSLGLGAASLYNKTIPPLFQKSVMGQTDPLAQQVARETSAAIPGVQAAARGRVSGLTDLLPDVTQNTGRELRQGLESLSPVTGPLEPAITGQKQYANELLTNLNALGHPDQALADPALSYATRQATIATKDDVARQFSQSMKPQGQLPAREEILKGLPTEGVGSINALTRDKNLLPLRDAYQAGTKQPLADLVKKDYMGVDPAKLAAMKADPAFHGTPQLIDMEAKALQGEHLADWLANSVPKELAEQGLGFFDRHPHLDFVEKAVRDETRILKTQGLHSALAKMSNLGAEGASLSEVLNRAGLTYKDAAGNSTALQATLNAMIKEGKLAPGATLADLADWTIPYNQVDKVTRFTKAATSPEGLKPFLSMYDSATNLIKSFQTALWPANWARNQGQAMFQNWVHDAYNAQAHGPMKYVKPLQDAMSWRNGKVIEGSSAYPGLEHLSDEAATKVLNDEIKRLNIATAFKNPESDILGGDIATRQLLPEVSGQARKPFGEILKGYIPRSIEEANPLNVAGVGQRAEDVFAPIKAGRELNQEMHAADRVSTYLAKRSQGFTPEAALSEMRLAHYDFANMTDFEKSTMRRLIPFYNFARQNIPAVVTEIASNPGGKLATSVKATIAAKGEHPGFIPKQISSGIAAPLGEEDETGTRKYLTHLGLGFEDLGNLGGQGGPLGMLNPLIKAPIESLTGKQLISGRDLADLHSRIGDTTGITPPPLVENLLMNSPIGRVATTGSTLADPRKSILDKLLNVGTGIRVSDVDVNAARRNAVNDYIKNNLLGPGVHKFDTLSVRPEDFAGLNPFEQQLYQEYRKLQQGRRPAPVSLY